MKIGIVAGEASGDILGGRLMAAIREREPEARFFGVGGDNMLAQGLHALAPLEALAVNGFKDPLLRLPSLLRLLRRLRRHFLAQGANVVVGVDFNVFNLMPLDAHGVDINADALAYVVAQSQCYPYFVQLWGDALWQQHLATNAATVASEHADAVRSAVAARVAKYHQRRFAELESEGLVPAAAAVAQLFAERDAASDSNQEVDAALALAGIDDTGDRNVQREALNRLDYVWRPPNQQSPFRWYAGIPSLMTHVLKEAGKYL